MEDGLVNKWRFLGNKKLSFASSVVIKRVLTSLKENLNQNDTRPIIPLGRGDPSAFPSFQTTSVAEDAIVDAVKSAKFNHYSPNVGILPARRAIADYLNRDLPYKLSPDDVYVTVGCKQAIEVIVTVLTSPGANILLPRPGYPTYEAYTRCNQLEVRYFDLLPEKGWEVDLDAVEALADENTVAMVIINPGNPCGNVYTYQHLNKIAETARKLGIMVISDEVYQHLTFGSNPFVPMGVFGSIVPVITLGSISKRWMVPGWRLGWLVTSDPNGILQKSGIVESIKDFLTLSSYPATFTQVKLNLSLLEGIDNDTEFCLKLAKEESVIILPGVAVGLKDWLRITFAVELSALEDGLGRVKAFCQRHAKKQ
ncbi:hypothetical protein LWI29_032242 [Acer saccharum]|uniref:Aminotransferase class I/classII large domain-containing protein n=1 Tax=Acer saccharum TaxID=4024 RepID=A0AA39VTZ9_ACESA|nr:hypothetical protein LWI29_032242 [Acer saccharum]